MEYREEDFLMLSGLQHFKFCRRQWALIHIENQWAENFRTADGSLMHQKAHDKGTNESRGDIFTVRGMNVFSRTLGVSGECDVVEFHKDDCGISLQGRSGLWRAYPVEYKRGKPNSYGSNELQLCAQAMCLEEMLCCDVEKGALFYGETRQRVEVMFSEDLRSEVREILAQMHEYYRRGHTPKSKPTKACNACSLKELCLPTLMKNRSVDEYICSNMENMI